VRPLLIAIAFLTRLPVRVGEVREHEFGAASAWFPVVGFGIGALTLGVYTLSLPHLGAWLSGFLVLVLSALLSGGLHLDGLADFFDALGGGRGERQRMLAIMRDPHIGAHGASALVLLLAGKLCALAELTRPSLALLGAPAVARLGAVWLMRVFPSARADGLGHSVGTQVSGRHVAIASALTAGGLLCFVPAALPPILASLLATALLGRYAAARLGGLTGDIYGAAIELAELVFWIVARAGGS
jgi:adenosylcobinamide-GDP ribazoletransferase